MVVNFLCTNHSALNDKEPYKRENAHRSLPGGSVGGSSVPRITKTALTSPSLEYLHVIRALNPFVKVISCPGGSQCAVLEKSK